MPDISSSYQYSVEFKIIIDNKICRSDFSYRNWSDADLETVRCSIRSFYRRAQIGKCAYCRNTVSLQSASNCHVEHIAPKSLYQKFMFEPKNLCVVCADCNEIKREQETLNEVKDTIINGRNRSQYPRSSSAFKIVHPHFDNYDDHILIKEGFYIDKSMKGHFTIGVCRLNRRLHEFGWEEETFKDIQISEIMNSYLDCKDPQLRLMYLKKLKKKLNNS